MHCDPPRSDVVYMACPLPIYSNICEVEQKRKGNTKMARKRTKSDGLRGKMPEREASLSDILSLNLLILALFPAIFVLLWRFGSSLLNKCAKGIPYLSATIDLCTYQLKNMLRLFFRRFGVLTRSTILAFLPMLSFCAKTTTKSQSIQVSPSDRSSSLESFDKRALRTFGANTRLK